MSERLSQEAYALLFLLKGIFFPIVLHRSNSINNIN